MAGATGFAAGTDIRWPVRPRTDGGTDRDERGSEGRAFVRERWTPGARSAPAAGLGALPVGVAVLRT